MALQRDHARVLQERKPPRSAAPELGEPLLVGRQVRRRVIPRHPVQPARDRVRLVAAEQHPARLGAAVDEVVGVSEAGHVARQLVPVHRLQRDVLMVDRHRRRERPHHGRHLRRPDPAGVDHVLGLDPPAAGQHRPHRAPVIKLDPRHARVLQHRRPQLAGGVGQRVRGRVRVDAAVLLDPDRAVQIVPAGLWHPLQRLVRRQHVHVQPDAAGPARAPLQLHQALRAGRDPEAAQPVEHPQPLVQLHAVAAEPHHRRGGVELGHQTGRVAGRTAGQLSLFDQHARPANPPAPGGRRRCIR